MTVNGYIATERDETPWSDETWESYYKIISSIGNMIIGRKTYEMIRESDELEKLGNPLTVVLTAKPQESDQKVFCVNTPQEAVELMNKKGFQEVVIGGGSSTNAAFLKERLIDEIILDVEPLVFGRGVSLFSNIDSNLKLELLGSKKVATNVIQLHYKVK